MQATRAMHPMKQSCLYKKGIYEDMILSFSGSSKAVAAQDEMKYVTQVQAFTCGQELKKEKKKGNHDCGGKRNCQIHQT